MPQLAEFSIDCYYKKKVGTETYTTGERRGRLGGWLENSNIIIWPIRKSLFGAFILLLLAGTSKRVF